MTRFRIVAGILLALALHPCHAQTYTGTAATAPVELRAGLGTGKVLSTHPDTAACVAAAESAASKAATAKDSTATCRPAGGNVAIKYTPKPVPDPKPDVVWVQCALERQAGGCQFTGEREVRFGTSPTIAGQYASKTVTGPVACMNVVFGDPVVGVEKKCWTTGTLTIPTPTPDPTPAPTPTPTPVAGGVPTRESFDGFPVVGQITATPGQVIERVRVTSTSGPCIRVSVPNVTIRDALIGPCGTDVEGKGIDAQSGTTNLTMQRLYFEDVSTGVTAHQATHPLLLTHSYIAKIRGPMPKGQLIQFDKVQGSATSRVLCNVADSKGQPSKWRKSEDWVNVYATSNVEVAYNRFRGGSDTSTSGTAILFGDSDGGTNLWAHHNTIVDVSNVGIGIAGGDGGRADANRIYMDGPTSGNYTNVGIYASRQGTRSCANARITNNRIWVRKNNGDPNSMWIELATCPGSTESGNTRSDASLTAAIFDEVPAQCQ